MLSSHDAFIHELSPEQIFAILKDGQWKTLSQTVTSAETNDNSLRVPDEDWPQDENTAGVNAFHDITFDKDVKSVLDVGGGKFDFNRDYLKNTRNVTLHVWDPYNRTSAHNSQTQQKVTEDKVDASTSMSVLNVIPEVDSRLAHIVTVWKSLNVNSKAYFKIWPGEGVFKGTYLPSSTSSSYQANSFMDRFLIEIQIVFGRNSITFDKNIPNLIIAIKQNDSTTSLEEIIKIQQLSRNFLKELKEKKSRSIVKINDLEFSIALTNFSLFKKVIRLKSHEQRLQNQSLALTNS